MPFWAGAGAGLIAGGIGAIGAALSNNANAREAKKNRQFQERMSSTAQQREAADMQAAGRNPLLPYSSGASAPSGAQAVMENTLEGLAASARDQMQLQMQKAKNDSEIKLMQSQEKKNEVDAAVATKGIPEADMKNKAYKAVEPYLNRLLQWQQNNASPKQLLQQKRNP
ncbi:MAG: DNA pilot protein [Microvirus sp.]|nr:MAG: DNA pilot protein [Microvirus sp.]